MVKTSSQTIPEKTGHLLDHWLVIEGKTFDLIYRNLGEYAKEN